MFRNYLTVAIRNFLKHRGYTMINILGLSTGITCSILIFLWTADELGMDKFHEKDSRLYLILRNLYLSDGAVITMDGIPHPVKDVLETAYPEVENVATVSWNMEYLFEKDGKLFRESGVYVSDRFFDVLTYPLVAGDRTTALADMHSIILSERLATKYFGESAKALSQTLRVNGRDFKVTGVVTDPGTNSSLHFDWIIPSAEFISRNDWVESWYNGSFSILVTLKEGADASTFSKKIEQEINTHTNNAADERLMIQKYSDYYLHSTYEGGVNTGGRIDYVYMLIIVAMFTVVIACVNFMNLATARSAHRSREIGLRKVMGAHRLGLGVQFLTEATVISFCSVVLAIAAAWVALPYFNNLTGKQMTIGADKPVFWLAVGALALLTGFLSGSYPALLLPSFRITNSLKGSIKHTLSGKFFRKGLVVFQFGLSILLIFGTIAVLRQMDFIMTKNLGLNKDNLLLVDLEGETDTRFQTYRDELLKLPGVESVTASSGNPLNYGRSSSSPTWEGKDPQQEVEINILSVSADFRKTMQTEILKGRDFSDDLRTDSLNFVVNEQAVRIMGFEDPIGKSLTVWGKRGHIIGVVKSFHMSTLYEPIAPLIIRYDPTFAATAFIRVDGDLQETVRSVEKLTKSFNPAYPFSYKFLDEEYAAAYRSEQMISSLVSMFAGLAIFISCLGLLGLCAFSAEQRRRELGIRKVHGASAAGLIGLLSRDYTLLIVIAFMLSAPVAWFAANSWLDRFAFRTSIGVVELMIAGLSTFLIAALTVGFKSWQAARINPVDALREE